mmetsp:Transcript_149693/g.480648  ORF Transcript_149693/g.480648 Transcript_149693/m.480648 type:complete len:265 (+) Transcript_149693:4946-5740(+)
MAWLLALEALAGTSSAARRRAATKSAAGGGRHSTPAAAAAGGFREPTEISAAVAAASDGFSVRALGELPPGVGRRARHAHHAGPGATGAHRGIDQWGVRDACNRRTVACKMSRLLTPEAQRVRHAIRWGSSSWHRWGHRCSTAEGAEEGVASAERWRRRHGGGCGPGPRRRRARTTEGAEGVALLYNWRKVSGRDERIAAALRGGGRAATGRLWRLLMHLRLHSSLHSFAGLQHLSLVFVIRTERHGSLDRCGPDQVGLIGKRA